ncbi:Laccase-7 [Apostasia shenzhenica]|uniref:Laccase n=1 Tax=Apostasia shenzhenica TaxID=1088818 RepID=A0A2I0B5R5_9ASPA|nr:Laccase-7 [Apostasia shenzhenica]
MAMVRFGLPLVLLGLGFLSCCAEAKVVEHTFSVGNYTVRRLCNNRVITVVNKMFPGPTISVHEGDTIIVHVINESPYNMTIHWHGIFQIRSQWADGPNLVTQCPIRPGNKYTYRFSITGQEGTLWWHAHVSVLRATVYGPLIIRPRAGRKAYPFPKPYKEAAILLGEWWDANVVDVSNEALATGQLPNISDAFTINGKPGDLYRCSNKHTFKLNVVHGRTYLLRIINAALNNQLFFKIAGHNFTVVATDASYTVPFPTDTIVIAPGQTVDALMLAGASPDRRYYIAARAFISSSPGSAFDNTTTTGILRYKSNDKPPPAIMPALPAFNDTPTAYRFYSNLMALLRPGTPTVPLTVDERMLITVGLGLVPCAADQPLCSGQAFAASMNNVSFQLPTAPSVLEARFRGIPGVYTRDFPDQPPVAFDYTNPSVNTGPLVFTAKGLKAKPLRYNATVEVVLQNTAILTVDNHPIHLHGFNLYLLAQGFGNFNATEAVKRYNLVNPQTRNTIGVPAGGWAVFRFRANNPGIWLMHCHLDVHLPIGLATVFDVDDGPTPETKLPPPPPDFPRCSGIGDPTPKLKLIFTAHLSPSTAATSESCFQLSKSITTNAAKSAQRDKAPKSAAMAAAAAAAAVRNPTHLLLSRSSSSSSSSRRPLSAIPKPSAFCSSKKAPRKIRAPIPTLHCAIAGTESPEAATATKKRSSFAIQTLTTWLLKQEQARNIDAELTIVLSSISMACKQIASLVQRAGISNLTGVQGAVNVQGEDQKKLDVVSNEVFSNCLKSSGRTKIIASEEEDVPVAVEESYSGNYIVVFDPLDGSSNIDAAVSTGSIFGIYSPYDECLADVDDDSTLDRTEERCVVSVCQPGTNLLAAGYCMYSSSVILALTVGNGVFIFNLDPLYGEFVLTQVDVKIPRAGKIYSFNEGNYLLWDERLRAYVDSLKEPAGAGGKPYSARYIGSLVGDFHRTLLYGGIYGYPRDQKSKNGKLRLLYECAPMSFIAEQAGGKGSDGHRRILDIKPEEVTNSLTYYLTID